MSAHDAALAAYWQDHLEKGNNMPQKTCAICGCDIRGVEEPAVLFIGKYGRRYTVCADCEKLMDTFISGEDESEKTAAAKQIYDYLFNSGLPKTPELLAFFKELFTDSEKLAEAEATLAELEAEESAEEDTEEAEAVTSTVTSDEEAVIPTEEEFLADREKPMSLFSRILFFLLFLLLGGGAIFYGVVSSMISLTVIGALVALLGLLAFVK